MNTGRPREFFIGNLWRRSVGLSEKKNSFLVTMEELFETEWSPEFEQLCRNRLAVGGYRYSRMNDPEEGHFEWVQAIIDRATLYQETGNDELLIDVANFAMVEFLKGRHPKKHFTSMEDVEHVKGGNNG